MVDNKVNMSLDDIIKKERSDRGRPVGGVMRGGVRGKRGNFAGARRGFRGGMRSNPVRGTRMNVIGQRRQIRGRGRGNFRQRQSNLNIAGGSGPLNNAATARLVNKLVKRAINQQTNQSLIQGPSSFVGRRRVAALATARVPITFARRGARRGGLGAGILRGVSQRSRVIGGNAARRARTQLQQRRQIVIATSPRNVRGRGIPRMGRLVSDEVPVMYESDLDYPSAPPMAAIRRAHQVARFGRANLQSRQMLIDQRSSRRPYIVRRARSAPIRPRYVQMEGPGGSGTRRGGQRVIVVSNEPYIGRRVQQQQQQYGGARYQQMVVTDNQQQQPRVRFLDREPQTLAGTSRRNEQMRAALGIGQFVRNRRSDPERFEASESFLQRVPARRGRGFKNPRYVY